MASPTLPCFGSGQGRRSELPTRELSIPNWDRALLLVWSAGRVQAGMKYSRHLMRRNTSEPGRGSVSTFAKSFPKRSKSSRPCVNGWVPSRGERTASNNL
jgi:hypothetical protein